MEQSAQDFGWSHFSQVVIISAARVFDGQQSFISIFSDTGRNSFCATSLCDPFTTGLPASSYFLGSLLGGLLLSTLADSKLGRKKMLFLSCFTMCVAALATIFSGTIWIYSALRFVSGFGRASIGTCVTVLLMENTPKQWRGRVGVMGFLFFTLGFLSLPGIAYLNRNSSWKALYLWTSTPGIFYSIIIHVCVSESSRWLLMQGRFMEAKCNINITCHTSSNSPLLPSEVGNNPLGVDLYSSMKELLGRRWAIIRITSVTIICFGIGIAYYGMPIGVKNLGFDEYLSVTFNALIEISTYLLTVYVIEGFNRKTSLLAFCVASAIFSIMCPLAANMDEMVKLGLELVAFFNVIMACNIVLIYVTELFPTSVRNSASALASQALVLGAVFSPQLVAAGRSNMFMSYGVFGVVILCCGLFVVYLPETKGVSLCDTMVEQEELERMIVG